MNLKKYGKWALITGCSSGLGKSFAYQLASFGINCVLIGLEGDKLKALASELEAKFKVSCLYKEVDLGSDIFLDEINDIISDIEIDILVNNAGINCGGDFWALEPQKLDSLVRINCQAPVQLTRNFLPGMKERKRGAIIFVSSIMGFITAPGESAYNASKAFGLHFGESLWGELRGSGVDVITSCPAGISTDFYRNAGFSPADQRRMARISSSPDVIALNTFKNLGRKPVYTPATSCFIRLVFGWMPRPVMTLSVRKLIRKYLKFYGA